MALHEEYRGFEHLYDARIRTEDGFEFPIHRVLLAMRSEYFHDLLCNNSITEDADILIRGIQGPTMEIILEYIYTGKLNLTGHNIRDILVAAYFLGIDELLKSSRISAVRNLTIQNSVPLFLAATKIEKLGILKACSRFIEVNFVGIVRDRNSRFQDLPSESLQHLLALDSLNVSNESQIWNAIEFWVSKCPEERQTCIKNLIPCIRFYLEDNLASEVLEHPYVKENPCCIEIEAIITSHSPVLKYRVPKMVFFFTKQYINRSDYSDGIKVYITYDEDIDIWRSISSKIFCPDVVLHGLGPFVVLAETTLNVIYAFDILSKTWSILSPPSIPNREYSVVKSGSHVYALGGLSPAEERDEMITAVERYNFDFDRWEFTKPHGALSQGAAATIDNCIYIIGTVYDWYGCYRELLAAQVYNPDTDMWRSITAPTIYRRQFALTVYENRLFIIGGHSSEGFLKSVEVYNVEENAWRRFQDLPFPYFLPKAVIIKDALYVYDNHSDDSHGFRCPPVLWDKTSCDWQVVEASSPFCDLHFYQFCTIEDSTVIMEMRQENRDPSTKWEESPFFTHLNS